MSVYTRQNGNNLKQAEVDLYGSNRLGVWKPGRDVQQLSQVNNSGMMTSFVQGQKEYELSNHLGNVMATLADTRKAIATSSGTTVDHYEAVVLSAHDYYPFGMQLPGRNRTDGSSGTLDNPTGRTRMEAESYDPQQSYHLSPYNSSDVSGGAALNTLNAGDYATYTVTTPVAGTYTLKLRLSNYYTSAVLQIRNAQDAVLATVNVQNTTWNYNYTTQVATVVLPAGTQTLKFYCSQSGFGMDWWELTAPGTLSGFNTSPNIFHVEAEDYIDRQGMEEQNCGDAGGTKNIYAAYQGDWADYRITAPIATNYTVRLRVATSSGYGVSLALKNAAGTILSTINVPGTGSNQQYTTLTTTVSLPAGDQTLRVFNSSGSFSVNWLEIEKPATADNGALQLNGSDPNGGGLLFDAENTFTVEFMVKPASTHEIDVESDNGYGGTSGQKYVMYPINGGDGYGSRAGMGVSVGTNGVSVYEHADGYMPALLVWQCPPGDTLKDWTHVAVVYNNRIPSLYINGQFKKTGVQSARQHVFPGTQFPAGGYLPAEGGKLDELRIWKVARTAQQIRDNMNGEIAGNTPGLAGYWPMNEGSGNTLHDVSGNGRDVSLNSSYNSSSWVAGRYSVELSSSYRYGFNGKELDTDLGQDDYDYGMRIHDARLGRFLSVDPLQKQYPWYTPYQFAGNSPIKFIDLDGLEPGIPRIGPSTAQLNYAGRKVGKAIGDFFGGMAEVIVAFAGAATQAPAAMHYGDKVPKEKFAEQFPSIPNNNIFKDLVVPIFTGPVKLAAELGNDPTNPRLWGEAAALIGASTLRFGSKGSAPDIALGLNEPVPMGPPRSLIRFAKDKNAYMHYDWTEPFGSIAEQKLTDVSFGNIFDRVIEHVVKNKGTVKFDITNLKMDQAASDIGKGALETKSLTNYEFNKIMGNKSYLKATEFYENGKLKTTREVVDRYKKAKTSTSN